MDAVFADPDGGFTVVDWKTGPLPDESRLPALSVQLAAYRLAWAALAGCPVERVRAAFHFVRAGVTLRPADLLDADGLRALLDAVPTAGRQLRDRVPVQRGRQTAGETATGAAAGRAGTPRYAPPARWQACSARRSSSS